MIKFNDIKLMSNFINSNLENKNPVINLKIDSRETNNNTTFLGLEGEKYNSLRFLSDIKDNGCEIFIFEDNKMNHDIVKNFKQQMYWICVKNSIAFLHEFTRQISDRIKKRGGNVVAISGSNGKTTTRQMIEHLFKESGINYISTQKNNNNHIGVPLTLLQADENTRLAIIELGSNHPGEIEVLCKIVNPNIAVCTNIGETHLEFFPNGIEGVFLEEGYTFKWIEKNGGVFFLNLDDNYLSRLRGSFVKSYGISGTDYCFTFKEKSLTIEYAKKSFDISNRNITGKHNLFNLGLAFIISREINEVSEEYLLERSNSFFPTSNRSEWRLIGKTKIFLDAYNANPTSMLASINGFRDSLNNKDTPLYVIADMNELGQFDIELHNKMAEQFSKLKLSKLIFIGRYRDSFLKLYKEPLEVYDSVDSYLEKFHRDIDNYSHIFIKGSRSLQLERLVDIT